MEPGFIFIMIAVAAVVGAAFGYRTRQNIAKNQLGSAEGRAMKLLEETERKSKEMILDAKDKAVATLEEAKKKEQEREEQIARQEGRLEKREEQVEKKTEEFERGKQLLEQKAEEIREIRRETEKIRTDELERLQKIAGFDKEEAKNILLQLTEDENKESLVKRMSKLEKEGREELERKALSIMGQVIQKYARSHVSEFTTTTVSLPSDEVKGKIIGKEGRNIRTLEKLTGVELIVDDTPESVLISGFDPVRREIARIALEKLIADGRIHPARIEETVEEAKSEIDDKIKEAGEAAAYEVGVAGLHPKLVYILGRLRYRYSYKQNILIHSLEVSYLAGALAG